MKKFLTVTGALYVCFAILAAASYTREGTSAVADGKDTGANVVKTSGCTMPPPGVVRAAYSETARVVVWTTPGCYGCEVFKRDGVPKLIEAGILVEIIDATVTPPTDKTIKTFPTIIAYDDGVELQRWIGAAPVSDILAAIPQTIEPPEYRIWDFRRWWN